MTREVELPVDPEQAMDALRLAVEEWGGGFGEDRELRSGADPHEFAVPIRAGIRVGYAKMLPRIESTPTGCRMRLEVTDQVLHVNRAAFVVLLMGAGGGLITMVGPLHDSLLQLVPIGAVLALVAWFMVASRARSAGAEELLETVANIAEAERGDTDAEGS